jgi:hypothetical protein
MKNVTWQQAFFLLEKSCQKTKFKFQNSKIK